MTKRWVCMLAILGLWVVSLLEGGQMTASQFGGDFVLESTLGKPFEMKSQRGKLVFVAFGFTTCPDICPMTLNTFKSVKRKLGDLAKETSFVFISFDSERDSLDKLSKYIGFFDKSFIGVRGTPKEIRKVADAYGVEFERQESKSSLGYLYAHSDFYFLVAPDGEIASTFDSKTPVDVVVDETRGIWREAQKKTMESPKTK